MADRRLLEPSGILSMYSYFARHEVDTNTPSNAGVRRKTPLPALKLVALINQNVRFCRIPNVEAAGDMEQMSEMTRLDIKRFFGEECRAEVGTDKDSKPFAQNLETI